MAHWAYLFEVRSLQEYILEGRDFPEQIAASKRAESICGEILSAVLDTLGLGEEVRFSRRTVGAFQAILSGAQAEEKIRRFRDLWAIVVWDYCPSLEFIQTLAQGQSQYQAVEKGSRELARWCSRPETLFPEAPPIARRDPRSGQVVITKQKIAPSSRDLAQPTEQGWDKPIGGLADTLLDELLLSGHALPAQLAPKGRSITQEPCFPWLPGNSYLAIVRIGINGQAEWLASLSEASKLRPGEFTRLFREFFQGTEAAMRTAALCASAAVLVPATQTGADGVAVLPARPLLLRDGEFTGLVRADLAVPFAAALLTEFERASERSLSPLRTEVSFSGPALTACAGIAFAKASRPLRPANRLAESLREQAMAEAGRALSGGGSSLSSLAFSLVGEESSETHFPAFKERTGITVGFPAYGVAVGALPRWNRLDQLAGLLSENDLAHGPTRQLASLMQLPTEDAARQYRHWRDALGKALPHRLERLDALLASLGIARKDLPIAQRGGMTFSPLADALVLRTMGHGSSSLGTSKEQFHG